MLNTRIAEPVYLNDQETPENFYNFDFEQERELKDELESMTIIYDSAIKEIMTKLNILNAEFIALHSRNPIHTMKSRVKQPGSIIEKLRRKKLDLNLKNVKEGLDDVAGVRIICPYIKDIYVVKQLVENQDDLNILRIRDYIKNPKPNGYRSLHIIVEVPVFFSDHKEMVKVEVQIRTIAMDFWASLEHQLRYKQKNQENILEDISDELKACADIIAQTDLRMQDIHNRMNRSLS